MAKLYLLKITYKDCDNKIWRKAWVRDSFRLVDLGYLIISSFDTYADKLFSFFKDNEEYEAFDETYLDTGVMLETTLEELSLRVGDKLEMIYDYDFVQPFEIELLEESDFKEDENDEDIYATKDLDDDKMEQYPKIIDGRGKGIIEGLSPKELLEAIAEEENLGVSSIANERYFGGNWKYSDYSPIEDDEMIIDELECLRETYEIYEP